MEPVKPEMQQIKDNNLTASYDCWSSEYDEQQTQEKNHNKNKLSNYFQKLMGKQISPIASQY